MTTSKTTRWVSLSGAVKLLHMPPAQVEALAAEEGWPTRHRSRQDGIEEAHFPLAQVKAKQAELSGEPGEHLPVQAAGAGMEGLLAANHRLAEAQVQTMAELMTVLEGMNKTDPLADALQSLADRRPAASGGWIRTLFFLVLVTLLVGGGFLLAQEHLGKLLKDARLESAKQEKAGYRKLADDYQRGLATLRRENDLAREQERKRLASVTRELEAFRKRLEKQVAEPAARIKVLQHEKVQLLEQRARETGRLGHRVEQGEAKLAALTKERDGLKRKLVELTRQVATLKVKLQRTLTPEEIRKLEKDEEDR